MSSGTQHRRRMCCAVQCRQNMLLQNAARCKTQIRQQNTPCNCWQGSERSRLSTEDPARAGAVLMDENLRRSNLSSPLLINPAAYSRCAIICPLPKPLASPSSGCLWLLLACPTPYPSYRRRLVRRGQGGAVQQNSRWRPACHAQPSVGALLARLAE